MIAKIVPIFYLTGLIIINILPSIFANNIQEDTSPKTVVTESETITSPETSVIQSTLTSLSPVGIPVKRKQYERDLLVKYAPKIKSVSGNVMLMNQGQEKGIKDGDLYYILDKKSLNRLGKGRVINPMFEESIVKLVHLYKNSGKSDIRTGQILEFITKRKRFNIGTIPIGYISEIGIVNTFKSNDYYYDTIHKYGIFQSFIVFKYITPFDLGLQFDLSGIYKIQKYFSNVYTIEKERLEYEIQYSFPITIKYNFNYDYPVSFYLGVGGARNLYFHSRYIGNVIIISNGERIAPVLSGGVDFFTNQLIQLFVDVKYYFGLNIDGFDTSIFTLGIGTSINW